MHWYRALTVCLNCWVCCSVSASVRARAAAALLPSLLELLARDYRSWAAGEARRTSRLAPRALQASVMME